MEAMAGVGMIASGMFVTALAPRHRMHWVLLGFSASCATLALTAPVGLALASPLGEAIGIRWLFVVIGVAGALVSLSGFLSPALRNLDRPEK